MAQDIQSRIIIANPHITATKQARQVSITFDPDVFKHLVQEDAEFPRSKVIKGIPADAEFIRYVWDGEWFSFIFEHESFLMVHVGEKIPVRDFLTELVSGGI